MTSREAVDSLVEAVERAGAPWTFVPSELLAGRELRDAGSETFPLVLPDGEMRGVVLREEGRPAANDALITVLLHTVTALVSAERAEAEARRRAAIAEQEARVDPLTQLANRRAWDDALAEETARMHRNGRPPVIVVIDIDDLKGANDTDGHLAGDLLIRRTAEALRLAVREEDVVARLGGDEFGVLAVESGPHAPETLVKRIEEVLAELAVEASVGAAAAEPGGSLQDTFVVADRRMYDAKRRRQLARQNQHALGLDEVADG